MRDRLVPVDTGLGTHDVAEIPAHNLIGAQAVPAM